MFTTTRLVLLVVAALSLSACDTTPVREDRVEDDAETSGASGGVELIPLEDFEQGTEPEIDEQPEDLMASIEDDLRDGLGSEPPFRQTAYLDAADKLIHAWRLRDAELVLDNTDVAGLAPALSTRKRLLRAEIHFRRNDLDRARRDAMGTLRARNIDPTYISSALDIKARVDLRQDRPLEAARTWVQRDNYLTDEQLLAVNHERIWYALGHLNELDLQLAGQDGSGGDLQGWLDLSILFLELGGDRDGLRTAVSRWSNANRFHPAAGFAARLLGPPRSPGIRQIGLLLPLSSSFGTAAQRVYNGFDAAHQTDTSAQQPQVVFYDIGGEPSLIANYVGVATADGADVVVGPLGKSAVSALLETRQPEKPMVLLGTASENALPADGFQFDLAPEPEAQQVAEFMYASGHRRAAALYPDDEWGQRLYAAFAEHWEMLGGSLAEARAYQPESDDFTAPIKNLFNLTESETRKSFLEAKSGLNLDFEARRRQDIDALFMAARPESARLLKPQINFFQGHDLPVYSTSHVYAGSPDAAKNTDLDGITFPDMPWVLRDTTRVDNLKSVFRNAGYSDVSSKLFAFGFDAYQLALLAPDPALAGNTVLGGLTSELVAEEDGHIRRRMDWARFHDGIPVMVWSR